MIYVLLEHTTHYNAYAFIALCDFQIIRSFGHFRGAARAFACSAPIYRADCISRLTVKSFATRRTCARFDSLKIGTLSNARDATLYGREVSRSSHRRRRRRRCCSSGCIDCNRMHSSETRTLCMRSTRASSGSSISREYTME